MAKSVQTTKADPATAPAGEPPLIKPSSVQVNDCGQVWRSILVRAPEGMVADDLRSTAIWKNVQAVPQSALIKLDRLLVLAFDESWAVEAIVKNASNREAHLLIQKVYGFAAVGEGLFADGTYEVYWTGADFGVRRVADKVPVARGFSTEGQAIDELRRQYPRKVG